MGRIFSPFIWYEPKRTLLVDHIDIHRTVMKKVKAVRAFQIDPRVILLDCPHAMWTLSEGNAEYPTRWALIKAGFSAARQKLFKF